MEDLGVKIIAVLHWLRGLVYFVGALALLGVAHLSARMISAVANDTPFSSFTAGVGTFFAILVLVAAIFWFVLGVGIWSTRNWARVLTLVFAAFWLLLGLPRLMHFPTPWHFLRVVVDAGIIVFLLLPNVKRLFGAGAPA